MPRSVKSPSVVLIKPTDAVVPASTTLAAPACMSKLLALASVPLAMVPPVWRTPARVSVNVPRSSVPPLTTRVLASARRSPATPNASVPALTVVTPR